MHHKDRWFHLAISLFALTLAALSGIAIEYQRSPQRVQSWLAQFGLPSIATLQSWTDHIQLQKLIGAVNHSSDSAIQGGASQSGKTPTSTSLNSTTADNTNTSPLALVHVKGFSHNVSSTTVNHARQLLSQDQIPQHVATFLGFSIKSPATIELAKNATDYENALKSVGVSTSELHHLSLDTGGFTTGSTVIIPLYQNQTTPELVNTMSHELTHVFLNQNGGQLPSWINEGLAVTMGMSMQEKAESPLTYQGYARSMAENVLQAVQDNQLQPLTGNENQVIQGKASYDLELQDWLAIAMLLHNDGDAPIHHFLTLLHRGTSLSSAFSTAFGTSQANVNTQLTQLLEKAAKAPDSGVTVKLSVAKSFQGSLRILPHGSQTWDGLQLKPGQYQLTLSPTGTLTGVNEEVSHTSDTQPPDNETVYFNLDSSAPLKYQGQGVQDAGFALDYHDGLYGFVNSWITLNSGKTMYLSKPQLFGVQLQSVQEHSQTNPLLPLFTQLVK